MARLKDPVREAAYRVGHLAACFRQTGNVAAAWACWHLARAHGLTVPDVIAAEIDRFAAAISGIVDAPGAGKPGMTLDNRTVARLWSGERGGRGKKEPAGELAEWRRDSDIAADVWRRRDGGETEASAVASVAKARDKGESLVRAAVRRFPVADEDLSG